MTRGKGASADAEGRERSTKEASAKGRGARTGSGMKMNREMLALASANIMFNSGVNHNHEDSQQQRVVKPGSFALVPQPETSSPAVRRKKGQSAPPLPDRGALQSVQDSQQKQLAGGAADGKAAGAKRAAEATDNLTVDDFKGGDSRRNKQPKKSEQQRHVAGAGNTGEAGPSGGVMQFNPVADPNPATGVDRTVYVSQGAQLRRNKHTGKGARAPRGADERLANEDVPVDTLGVAVTKANDEPTAVKGVFKKPRQVKELPVAAALDGPISGATAAAAAAHGAAACTAQDAGERRVPLRQTNAVAAQPSIAQAATAAAATMKPLAGVQLPLDAAAATDPELLPARREGARPAQVASAGGAGPGPSGRAPQPTKAAAQPVDSLGSQQLPPTGTTPVKTSTLAAQLHESDKVTFEQFLVTQRQLNEVRAMYDDLKATKIQDLEKVLAEQAELALQQARMAREEAEMWKAAAKRADECAKAAGVQQLKDRNANLQAQVLALTREVAQLKAEVAQALRGKEIAQHEAQKAKAEAMRHLAELNGHIAEAQRQREAEELRPHPDTGIQGGDGQDYAGGNKTASEAAGKTPEPAAEAALSGGGGLSPGLGTAPSPGASGSADAHPPRSNGVGPPFPTPSPGVGAQFLNPSFPVPQGQGLLCTVTESASLVRGPGLGTECQRVVNMLPTIRTPAPSIPVTSQGGSAVSGGPGISTECLRIVQMLPGIRVPSPSVGCHLKPSAAPLATPADGASDAARGADGATPTAANGPEHQSAALAGSGKRRSTGSPIDGICGSGQRRGDGDMLEEPKPAEAHQDQYSFIDLNPASARKTPRNGAAVAAAPLAAAILGTMLPGNLLRAANEERLQRAGGASGTAVLLISAAAKALPTSPGPVHQGAMANWNTSANGPLLPGPNSPFIPKETSPARHTTAKPVSQVGVEAQPGPPRDSGIDASAMAAIHSGQDSCNNLPGFVARTKAQQQEASKPPVSPGHAIADPVAVQGHAPNEMAHAGQAAPQEELQCVPESPLTAKLNLYKKILRWSVDVISSSAPQLYRLTHECGLCIEIRQTELDDDEAAQASEMHVDSTAKFFAYIPQSFGTVGERLPQHFKEEWILSPSQMNEFLEKLNSKIKKVLELQPLK